MATGYAAELRAAHAEAWDAAVGHRFVRELWAGTVDDAVLAHYLAQDRLFVDAFVALLGQAVASTDRPASRMVLARQLGLVAGDEDDYMLRALDRLGADPDPAPVPATTAFLDLMHEVRRSGELGQVLAVLVVAEWLYLDWASGDDAGLDAEPPDDWLYRGWIELHRGPAFARWTAFLVGELDHLAAGASAAETDRIAAVFGRAVALEGRFFDAAYG